MLLRFETYHTRIVTFMFQYLASFPSCCEWLSHSNVLRAFQTERSQNEEHSLLHIYYTSDGLPAHGNSRTDERIFTKFSTGRFHSNWLIRFNAGYHATTLTKTLKGHVCFSVHIGHNSTRIFGIQPPPPIK
jgi:hypothetical protein